MKLIIQKICFGLSLLAICTSLQAQDPNFTQFYEAPVYLNPAFTGHIDGTYRFMAIYRNQWPGVGNSSTYSTPLAAVDVNLKAGEGNNSFGLGLMAYNDQSGGGVFNNVGAQLGFAYHLSTDRDGKHFLSAGAQVGVINKRINATEVTFQDQFNGEIIDPNIVSMDGVVNTSFLNVDLNAGLTWSSYFSKKVNVKLGAAVFHLIPAKETFYSGDGELPMRISGHLEADIALSDKIKVHPHVLYNTQASASELNAGLKASYFLNRELGVSVGGGTRINDAIYGLVGFEYKGLRLGFGFDLNTSTLKSASNGVGAYEVAITYTGSVFRKAEPIVPAIRFY